MYLGDAITFLESRDPAALLQVGLINPHSWRGRYNDLAVEPGRKPQTVADALAVLRTCVGRTFEGYKGGDFKMDKLTDLYLDHYGKSDGGEVTPLLLALLLGEPVEGDCEVDDFFEEGAQ
jgi:hypothetical protein